MNRITYIENAQPVTWTVHFARDLSAINHPSIVCENTGEVGLDAYDWDAWNKCDRNSTGLRLIVARCQQVDKLYFDLMVSGDISGSLNLDR